MILHVTTQFLLAGAY